MLAHALSAVTSRLPSSLKYRLSWAKGVYSYALKLGQPVQAVTTIHGHSFNWRVDSITSQEHLRGTYEPYMQDAFERYVKSNMTVLDIGAHNGFHSMVLASMGANTIAFEPNAESRASLQQQIEANPELKVSVMPYALSDEGGTARLVCHGAMSQVGANGVEIEKRTLDSLALSPDLIKIDVEGHEPQALRGGLETFRRCKPIIICDFNDYQTQAEIKSILSPLGYEFTDGPPDCAIPITVSESD